MSVQMTGELISLPRTFFCKRVTCCLTAPIAKSIVGKVESIHRPVTRL